MVDDKAAAWIVTGSGSVYETSEFGDDRPFESVIGANGYADSLDTAPITDPERLRTIAARLREIADALDGAAIRP